MGKQFVRKFFASELIGFGFGLPVASIYVLLLLNIETIKINKALVFAGITGLVVVLLAQPVNYFLSRKLKVWISSFEAGRLDKAEAVHFFQRLLNLPLAHGFLIFFRIGLGALVSVAYMYFSLGVSFLMCTRAMALCLYGGYLAGVIAFVAIQSLVSPIAQKVVASGLIDEEVIAKRRIFGLSVSVKYVFFLILPIVLTNISVFFAVYSSWIIGMPYLQMVEKVVGIMIVNIVTLIASVVFSLRLITRPLENLGKSLRNLSSGSGRFDAPILTDLSDEFAYVSYLMNRAILHFQSIVGKLNDAAAKLTVSIQDLNVASQEISTSSNQQAAGVKEIVSTMEDSDQLSKQVASRISEVAGIANKTKEVVNHGFDVIKESLQKMNEIKEANAQTIEGIRHLGEKIESIWDIVNIINDIADQTKIIAFNAELEAAAAGDAGKSFQIVASEIRRLADGTVTSTDEIKARINEIQYSSDHLIIASEEGTGKVIAGWELSTSLRKFFEDILSSAEISADSAERIEVSVRQQVSAFEQILMTLKQISTGIDSFVTSTKSTAKSTTVLMNMADDLRQVAGKKG